MLALQCNTGLRTARQYSHVHWRACIPLTSADVLLQLNLATVGVLHTAIALEDPFDNQGLDGIYVDEALFEAEQVPYVTCLVHL